MTGDRVGAHPFPLVLAGPSGGGKTTVGRALETRRGDVVFSVSATTRPKRRGERDGVDYMFVSRPEFEALIADGRFLEWAEVHGNLYGTPSGNLAAARAVGAHLLLDIDVEGSRSVKRIEPGTVSVFLLPPDADCAIDRLSGRNSEDAGTLRRRLETAISELAAVDEFDYVLVNEDLDATVDRVAAILQAEEARPRSSDWALALAGELSRELKTRLEN